MRQIVIRFLEFSSEKLAIGDRIALEALLALAPADAVTTSADELRIEIERRQGRELNTTTYRQRIKRLADALAAAKAPFRLVSRQGQVSVQPTFESDKDKRTGEWLSGHSYEKSLGATNKIVPLHARADYLTVMFSYAHIDEPTETLQRMQVEFFDLLKTELRYPLADYAGPEIRLWRDEVNIRKAKGQGWEQMQAVCEHAFFGLIMMSNKYPRSKGCLREAAYFISEDGADIPGKACLIVPVNVERADVPKRFSAGARIWMHWKGKDLLCLWNGGTNEDKHRFVREVAREIWEAAKDRLAAMDAGFRSTHAKIEAFAHTRFYEHQCERKAPLFGQEGRLSRNPGDAPQAPQDGAGSIEIVPHLLDWATKSRGPRLVALLGDFGMGKTVGCQLLTQELLKRRKDDPSTPLPVYLDLRDIDQMDRAGSTPLEDLIDQMLRKAGEQPPTAAEVISYVRERDALVIFDGLDEVTNKLTTDQAIRLYRELLSIIPAENWRADRAKDKDAVPTERGPRILVSCRTHYFRDIAAQRSFLIGQERGVLSPDEDIKIYYLLPFTEEQIAIFLGFFLAEDQVARSLALIEETYNLQELAARPIFLRFIHETLGRIEEEKRAGRTINIARLYDIFIEQSIERDNPKHLIPIREKRRLLAGLALDMHREGRNTFSNDALDDWFGEAAQTVPKLRRALAGPDHILNAERFLQDLRNASFLIRPGEEAFRFAHTSVREYFLANALHRSISERNFGLLNVPPVSRETIGFLLARQEVAELECQQAFLRAFPSLLQQGQPAATRKVAFTIWLASDFCLPRPAVMDLSDLDFSRRVFCGEKGRLLPLQRTVWRGAKLRQTEFNHVDLTDADFDGSIATMSLWVSCPLSGASWHETELIGSRWRDCRIDDGAFDNEGKNVREAIGCLIGEATWQPQTPMDAQGWQPLLERHSNWVLSVALGRVGARDVIVSGSYDCTVRLWDAASGEGLVVLKGHSGWVLSVALGRVGARDVIVSGGYDGTVRLWDAASGQSLAVLEGHSDEIPSLALGRVGARDVIVSGGSDGTVRLWDAASGESLAVLEGHSEAVQSVALGRVGARDVIVSGGSDRTVRLWDAASGESLAVLEGHSEVVQSVALGRVGARDVIVSGGSDRTVRLWDAASGRSLVVLEGHSEAIQSVALGRVGARDVIVSGGSDGTVRLWDAASGESLAVLEGHSDEIRSLALGRVGACDVIVSGSYDCTVRLWGAVSGESLLILGARLDWVQSVALGRVGARDVIVSGSYDCTVRLWDAASGEGLVVLKGHSSLVLSVALGRVGARDVIVSGGTDGTVRLWDPASGESLAVLEGHSDEIRSLALGRVGARTVIVSGGSDGTVRLWDAASGESLAVLEGHSEAVQSVALGRVGARDVIVSGGSDRTVRLWDAASGESLAVLEGHSEVVRSLALGRVGARDVIVSGSSDRTVRLWDAASGRSLVVLEGHSGLVLSVALGRVGARDVIVSGSYDGTVRLWDAASRESLAVLGDHSSVVLSVALGRVGARDVIVLGTADGTVRVWDAVEALGSPETMHQLVLATASRNAVMDLAPDGIGGHQIRRLSGDPWRYFLAQGRKPDGKIVTAPIEAMMTEQAATGMTAQVMPRLLQHTGSLSAPSPSSGKSATQPLGLRRRGGS